MRVLVRGGRDYNDRETHTCIWTIAFLHLAQQRASLAPGPQPDLAGLTLCAWRE